MSFYILMPHDQTRNNWLIHRWIKRSDKVPDYVPLDGYCDSVCPVCSRIDYDSVFELGFERAENVRAKDDIFYTDDGFLCFRGRVVELMKTERIAGAEFKPIADSDWHVVKIVTRIPTVPKVYETKAPPCRRCGKPTDVTGLVQEIQHFAKPPPGRTLFSSIEYRERIDRDLMFDDDVLSLLVKEGITGGEASELRPQGRAIGRFVDLNDFARK